MIKSVTVFENGMAMVFDFDGQQMPDFQGAWENVKEKVRESGFDMTKVNENVKYRY